MTPERWKQIDQLFDSTLRQEPSQQAAFLEGVCVIAGHSNRCWLIMDNRKIHQSALQGAAKGACRG